MSGQIENSVEALERMTAPPVLPSPQVSAEPSGPIRVRRWESAKTNRLNSGHWANATDQSINLDISADGTTLRTRCQYEASNNAYVEGMIDTYITDLAGPDGPTLQVHSPNDSFNNRLEAAWSQFWAMPDASGILSGIEMLGVWVRCLFTAGEFLAQEVNDDSVRRGVQLRLLNIHPRRLETPPIGLSDPFISNGVKRNQLGRPLSYYIQDAGKQENGLYTLNHTEVNAENIIHGFKSLEAGQSRGVPWLAPILQVAADLRDYNAQVLQAVRAAAYYAVYLWTDHPDAEFIQVDTSLPLENGVISTMVPGWKPEQLKPEQPHTKHNEFVDEKLRELGRVVNMPLMMVKLDSQKHSYSSARFDGQLYQRSIRSFQGWLQRKVMNRLVDQVRDELRLLESTALYSYEIKYVWTWPAAPHVDPTKEAKASEIRLGTGQSSLTDELAAVGRDLETHVKVLKREREVFAAEGVPYPDYSKYAVVGADDEEDDDEDATKKKDEQSDE